LADQEAVVEIYQDESLRRGSVDIVGAIWVESNAARTLRGQLAEVRAAHGWLDSRGEWKWIKTSGKVPHPAYLDLMRIAARVIAEDGISCSRRPRRSEALGAHQNTVRVDHYATWLMLLRRYTLPGCRYLVRLDSRTDLRDESRELLRDALNFDSRNAVGENCSAAVEARDSRQDDLIQLVDLLTGAVGWHFSRQHLPVGEPKQVCGGERASPSPGAGGPHPRPTRGAPIPAGRCGSGIVREKGRPSSYPHRSGPVRKPVHMLRSSEAGGAESIRTRIVKRKFPIPVGQLPARQPPNPDA
jgi:hypothetical protein